MPLYPLRCTSPRSSQFFELRITIYWISLETILNSFKILFDTSLPRVVGHKMLFLCFGFAVPSTVGSPLLDEVVRNWESIQSSLVKIWAGFASNQGVHKCNTSLLDSNKEGILSIALLELLFAIWVVDVILLQVGLKCLSSAAWTNRWIVHSQVSPCLFDLRLRFRLRLCLHLNVQQTLAHNSSQVSPCFRWCFRSQTRHLFRSPEQANQMVAHSSQVSPC